MTVYYLCASRLGQLHNFSHWKRHEDYRTPGQQVVLQWFYGFQYNRENATYWRQWGQM